MKLKAEREGDVTTLKEDCCIYGSWNPRPQLLYECRWSLHHLLLLIVPVGTAHKENRGQLCLFVFLTVGYNTPQTGGCFLKAL